MSTTSHRFHLPMTASIALALAACGEAPTTPATPTPAPQMQVTLRSSDEMWSQKIEGKTGPGSVYAFFVPRNWNGNVVYYAHGFADAAAPVALPDNVGPIALELGNRGYAVAYSSYSENGFAVKDGIQRTHQMRGLFTSSTGPSPARSYLIGKSLGGAVGLALAENFSSQYDGVMPMCGMVGGSLVQTQYLGHVRSMFDVLFPNVLPGSTMSMPDNVNVNTQIVGPAQAAVFGQAGGPQKLIAMALSPQTPLPTPDATNPAYLPLTFQSLATALSFHARGINDILQRVDGATAFDNLNTIYTSPLWNGPTQAAINAGINRYTIAPSAAAYFTRNWTPSGNLQIPRSRCITGMIPQFRNFTKRYCSMS